MSYYFNRLFIGALLFLEKCHDRVFNAICRLSSLPFKKSAASLHGANLLVSRARSSLSSAPNNGAMSWSGRHDVIRAQLIAEWLESILFISPWNAAHRYGMTDCPAHVKKWRIVSNIIGRLFLAFNDIRWCSEQWMSLIELDISSAYASPFICRVAKIIIACLKAAFISLREMNNKPRHMAEKASTWCRGIVRQRRFHDRLRGNAFIGAAVCDEASYILIYQHAI